MGGTNVSDEMTIFNESCFLEINKNEYGIDEIIVTSLNYLDVPIIRYKLGDCAEWIDTDDVSYKIKLNRFRENDFIIGENGNRYEPFIITELKFIYRIKITY